MSERAWFALELAIVAVLAALLAALTTDAREAALPEQAFPICARFTSITPSAVAVDVKEIGGAQLANDLPAAQQMIDGAPSALWCVDLDAVTGFAPDCAPRSYLVRFAPTGISCAVAASLCEERVETSGGSACRESGDEQTVVYPAFPIPSRGITAAVIAQNGPSYIRHDVRIGSAVAFSYYSVFWYDAHGRVARRQRSLAPPVP